MGQMFLKSSLRCVGESRRMRTRRMKKMRIWREGFGFSSLSTSRIFSMRLLILDLVMYLSTSPE